MQDEPTNLDDLTELEDASIFRLEQLSTKSYEKDYSVQLDITIEKNLNQVVIARDGYTILDFLSDVGGVQGLLFSAAVFLVGIWNYHYSENFLVSHLYRLGSLNSSDVGT